MEKVSEIPEGDWINNEGGHGNVVLHPQETDAHGKAAGYIRNQHMLDCAQPDGVVAFPGGRGTADMIKRAQTAGVQVWRPYK